ncbi:hypothetical protein Vadar_028117 [Vaccinium darrowii]|uniref:Uncharacterized protein n=1 Tax=Vaccinium darrowii TaxID=229202 RepID=A0ACB7Y9N6_9ERIC|nr:hypothetical protein Vadar_028117 [Vaccinium darrowii]
MWQKLEQMDEYIDEIRNHAHRLEAVGHHVDDDDLVFYTLNGLPVEEFKNLKTAVRTRGDVSFEELTTLLHSEEMQIHKYEASSSAKVFVTTDKGNTFSQNAAPISSSAGPPSSAGSSSQIQMFQPQNEQTSFYPQNVQSQNRNSGYDNRGRGRNTGGFGTSQPQGMPGVNFIGGNSQGISGTGYTGFGGFNGSGFGIGSVFGTQNCAPPYNQLSQFARSGVPQFGNSVLPQPAGHGFIGNGSQNSVNPCVQPTAFSAVTSSSTSPQWYFDSGASSHVTNSLANLQLHQPCTSGEGIVVGNGNSVPVTYSGHSNTSSSTSGTLPPGFVPHSDIL